MPTVRDASDTAERIGCDRPSDVPAVPSDVPAIAPQRPAAIEPGPDDPDSDSLVELDEVRMVAELRDQRRRLEEAQRRLDAAGFQVRSTDGLLGVSVERGVAVVGIEISPEAIERYSPEELGHRLADLVGEAVNHGAELFGAAFSATGRGPAGR